jgi:hypothetical protein
LQVNASKWDGVIRLSFGDPVRDEKLSVWDVFWGCENTRDNVYYSPCNLSRILTLRALKTTRGEETHTALVFVSLEILTL